MRISDWSSDVCSSDLIALAPAAEAQGMGRHVLGDRRTGAGRCAITEMQRCNQRTVGADENVLAHHRPEFVGAIVVASDGTGTDVSPRADLGVTEVAEMPGLGAITAGRVLQLDEVRSEEHTSELQSLMRSSYAVFC